MSAIDRMLARLAERSKPEPRRSFKSLLYGAVSRWDLRPPDRHMLDTVLGLDGAHDDILMSDIPARKKATEILVGMMPDHERARANDPTLTYYSMTFIHDIGNTLDGGPELNVEALKKLTDSAVRSMGLNAILVLELQGAMNYLVGGRGRLLMLHTHGIGWTNQELDPAVEMARLNGSRAWHCSLGAHPVDIRKIGDGLDELVRVARYITKLPEDAKNRMPSRRARGGSMMMSTTFGYRPDFALRIFEGLSQMQWSKSVYSVGDGKRLRTAWSRELVAWHLRRQRRQFDVATLWTRVRLHNGSRRYRPYNWLKGKARPKALFEDG